jgi:hypothetical protein
MSPATSFATTFVYVILAVLVCGLIVSVGEYLYNLMHHRRIQRAKKKAAISGL